MVENLVNILRWFHPGKAIKENQFLRREVLDFDKDVVSLNSDK